METNDPWEEILSSVETGLRYAWDIDNTSERLARQRDIIDYAHKIRGVPASELGELLTRMYQEKK